MGRSDSYQSVRRSSDTSATYTARQVELYTYNWPKEKWDHLHVKCSDLCQWTNARCSLLHSIVAQKLGLFHHQPFTRRHDQSSGQASQAVGGGGGGGEAVGPLDFWVR